MGTCYTTEETYQRESMLYTLITNQYTIVEDRFLFNKSTSRIVGVPKNPEKYGGLSLQYKGVRYFMNSHRAIWINRKGLIPVGYVVNHIDGIKSNNHLNNLELLTVSENNKHAHDTGLQPVQNIGGIKNQNARFKNIEDIDFIRSNYSLGKLSIKELSEIYDVSYTTIHYIVNYKTYN